MEETVEYFGGDSLQLGGSQKEGLMFPQWKWTEGEERREEK